MQKIIELDIIGGVAGTLSQQKTKTIPVFFSYKTEQEKITGMIKQEYAKIDLAISKAKQEIASIKEYRESIITAAVTGQLNVGEKQLQMN